MITSGPPRSFDDAAQLPPALDEARHRLRREAVSPCVSPQPGRPASSGSVTDHSQGLGLPCGPGFSLSSRTRPMMRSSARATPSVSGSHSGKVRRQVMAGSSHR